MGKNSIFLREIFMKSRIFIVSGILSGLVFYFAIQPTDTSAQVVAQFGGKWFPGLIFGILFAFLNKWPNGRLISYSSISAFAYYCAYTIAYNYVDKKFAGGLTIAGALAGGFGAFALLYILKLFSGFNINSRDFLIVIGIGAFTGAIFLKILFDTGEFAPLFKSCLVFAFWQSSVGVKIQDIYKRDIEPSSQISDIDEKIVNFLQGPIVQFIGLIASILGILSYFSK